MRHRRRSNFDLSPERGGSMSAWGKVERRSRETSPQDRRPGMDKALKGRPDNSPFGPPIQGFGRFMVS
jgi:hypothetical protein